MKYFWGLLALLIICPNLVWAATTTSTVKIDSDLDGLSDDLEAKFGTDPNIADSDGDGFSDGLEIKNAYSPTSTQKIKLAKKIVIDLPTQNLQYYLSGVSLGSFKVSTGKKSTPTPVGNFVIGNKAVKAWSQAYGLWMPYWLGMRGQKFGIHELPIWPNGYREGASHLGTPVSHGCIRLGIGPAKELYNFAEVGTVVQIK